MTGITNAINVLADAVAIPGCAMLIEPVANEDANPKLSAVFADIRTFYQIDHVPAVFRVMAHDSGYVADFWAATRHAFSDNRLTRRLKEALAFAVSVTTHSTFGAPFHLDQMRKLGVGDHGVMEVLGMTQMFSSYTKIADVLQLEPDMSEMAPTDWSPAPGGKAQHGQPA